MGQAWWWPPPTSRTGRKVATSPTVAQNPCRISPKVHLTSYLHDDEEEERDEDIDLRVPPGVVVADVVKLLGDSLAAPGAVVKQSDQGLVLRQLATPARESRRREGREQRAKLTGELKET